MRSGRSSGTRGCAYNQRREQRTLGKSFTKLVLEADYLRYCVHTTATWDQFCNIIKKVRNHSDGVFLVIPWLIDSRSYKKNQIWNITRHTSHITYYIGICKFYKILVINTVVTSTIHQNWSWRLLTNIFWWKSSHWQYKHLCKV